MYVKYFIYVRYSAMLPQEAMADQSRAYLNASIHSCLSSGVLQEKAYHLFLSRFHTFHPLLTVTPEAASGIHTQTMSRPVVHHTLREDTHITSSRKRPFLMSPLPSGRSTTSSGSLLSAILPRNEKQPWRFSRSRLAYTSCNGQNT